MAFPHIEKTGARPDAAHSEDGKNTETMVPRQTCHTIASLFAELIRISPDFSDNFRYACHTA